MVSTGKWLVCEDGVTRPTVTVTVGAAARSYQAEIFLVDTCADRTAFSAALLGKLGGTTNHSSPGFGLQGIGGDSPFVVVEAVLEFTRADGGSAHVRGEFAAFTDPAATDLSILGRDVLDNFDVIVSRRRNEVLLLAGNHQYRVEPL